MNVDLTPLVQALAALALAAVTAITPFLSLLLRRYLHVRLTAAEAAAVQSAADAGAKAAYGYIAVHNASYRDVAIRETAIAKGVQHVAASTPEALTDLGIYPRARTKHGRGTLRRPARYRPERLDQRASDPLNCKEIEATRCKANAPWPCSPASQRALPNRSNRRS
jgi:hypothetical protein